MQDITLTSGYFMWMLTANPIGHFCRGCIVYLTLVTSPIYVIKTITPNTFLARHADCTNMPSQFETGLCENRVSGVAGKKRTAQVLSGGWLRECPPGENFAKRIMRVTTTHHIIKKSSHFPQNDWRGINSIVQMDLGFVKSLLAHDSPEWWIILDHHHINIVPECTRYSIPWMY